MYKLSVDPLSHGKKVTHRVVGKICRGGWNSRTMIVFFRIVVPINPASESLTVPFVKVTSMEVPKIPEVAQVPKITEIALLVVSFVSKLPRHRRRLLLL